MSFAAQPVFMQCANRVTCLQWYALIVSCVLGVAPAGDLLAALLLARIHQSPDNLAAAVELAVAGLQGVLAATATAAGAAATAGKGKDDR